jgi:hypothetical protein
MNGIHLWETPFNYYPKEERNITELRLGESTGRAAPGCFKGVIVVTRVRGQDVQRPFTVI